MRYRKKKQTVEPADCVEADPFPAASPMRIHVVGAGHPVRDLIALVREHTEAELAGILDPDPALKGRIIAGCRVTGWLGDLDDLPGSAAVIGLPAQPDGFDRHAVYHILVKRGWQLPILRAATSHCEPDIDLRRGTVILQNATVRSGAMLGYNCLVGPGAQVPRGARVDDHRVMAAGDSLATGAREPEVRKEPRSLAAVMAREKDTIQEIIRKIDWAAMEIMLIVDPQGILVGTMTDGDIRRGILAGVDLHQPALAIMNRHPVSVPEGTTREAILELMRARSIRHVPVVDAAGRPVRLEVIDNLLFASGGQGAVVMAGGLGSRLRPLTESTPKPLLNVGGRPILDHILEGLKGHGLEDVVISVNYMADRIREHVGSGRKHRMNVSYLSERHRLGTAGALSLLQPRPRKPFLVVNGDLLTQVNYARLMEFQAVGGHALVMGVRQLKVSIPYGVADTQGDRVTRIREKPEVGFFINAGIYVVDPSCLDHIPRGRHLDMPDLVSRVIESGGHVGAFPIFEYWRDIGTPADLEAASAECIRLTKPGVRPEDAVLTMTLSGRRVG